MVCEGDFTVRSDILKGVSGKGTGSAPDAASGVTVTATKAPA